MINGLVFGRRCSFALGLGLSSSGLFRVQAVVRTLQYAEEDVLFCTRFVSEETWLGETTYVDLDWKRIWNKCCVIVQTRILFSSGGNFERKDSKSAWEYIGGETRLLSVHRSGQFTHFLDQLARANSTVWDEVPRGRAGHLCP